LWYYEPGQIEDLKRIQHVPIWFYEFWRDRVSEPRSSVFEANLRLLVPFIEWHDATGKRVMRDSFGRPWFHDKKHLIIASFVWARTILANTMNPRPSFSISDYRGTPMMALLEGAARAQWIFLFKREYLGFMKCFSDIPLTTNYSSNTPLATGSNTNDRDDTTQIADILLSLSNRPSGPGL
jgi:hypothetical protein